MILDYSIEGKNISNVADITDNNLSVSFNILDSKNNILASKILNHNAGSNAINLVRNELRIPIKSLSYTPLVTNIRASVKINNLEPKLGTFASLGHIFDYTSLANNEQPGREITKTNKIELINEPSVQNYPNPFNPLTNFEFQIVEPGFVSLSVFDVLGREIAVLVNEEKQTGTFNVSFDASQYPSGVYFYRLESNNKFITKKMLLLK